MILSPSLLSSDYARLGEELRDLEKAGLEWIHWDVMDGDFVPNITLGAPIIKCLRKNSKLFFDVHLMVSRPERYLADFAEAGADLICIHAEATPHVHRAVQQIKSLGKKAGVALNPHTPVCVLDHIIEELDLVLVMSVNPGFGGQSFIPQSIEKIRAIKSKITQHGSATLIEVDGGVEPANCKALLDAGADVLVSGSAFFRFPPYKDRLNTFLCAAKGD